MKALCAQERERAERVSYGLTPTACYIAVVVVKNRKEKERGPWLTYDGIHNRYTALVSATGQQKLKKSVQCPQTQEMYIFSSAFHFMCSKQRNQIYERESSKRVKNDEIGK